VFLPAFFSQTAWYGYDVIDLLNPFTAALQRSLDAHQAPLWLPGILGGLPWIASCNFQFLYPFDLLARLAGFSLATQLSLCMTLHVALAGTGMFLFLRRLGRSDAASLLGGLCFAFSGALVSQAFGGFYGFIEGLALVPWAFWATHRAVWTRSWFCWGLFGGLTALQVLAQATQMAVYSSAAVAAFAFAAAWHGGAEGRAGAAPVSQRRRLMACVPVLQGLALALALAFLIAAPQLWLTLQYLPYTSRQAYSLGEWLAGSVSLKELVGYLVPGFYGWREPAYHGAMDVSLTTEYLGLLPWALAASACAACWRREAWVRWMVGLVLAAFLLGQNHATPLHLLLHRLPVFSAFRWWHRVLFLATFGACALAAFGWDALRDPGLRPRALAGALLFCASAASIAVLAWIWAQDAGRAAGPLPWYADLKLDYGQVQVQLGAVARESAVVALGGVLLLAGLLWLSSRRFGAATALALVLALHAVDERQVVQRFVTPMDPGILEAKPHYRIPPPPPAGLEPERIFDDDKDYPNNALATGYENLAGLVSMPLLETERMRQAMAARWMDWASLFNVRWVFTHSRRGSWTAGDTTGVYENRACLPRARLLGRSRRVADDAEAWRLLADPAFDPRQEVSLPVDAGLDGAAPSGSVRWLSRDPMGIELEADTARAAALVVSNPWYPSWKCTVDGEDTPVLKAYGGLQAVVLKPGSSRVRFSFDGGLFYDALAACLAGLCALTGLGFREMQATD